MLMPRPDESQSQDEPEEFTALPASGNPFKNLAVINGVCVIGLIVDPGAARGLIGSATLREIFEKLLRPRGLMKHVMWYRSKNKFTGISSQPQHSIGICVFPIGLVGMKNAYFSCDVITGQSANCPGLIPLQTLLRLGSVISCGHFQNQDGLLGLRLSNGEMCSQRILLTDSSHYLLPIDNFDKEKNDMWNKTTLQHQQEIDDGTRHQEQQHHGVTLISMIEGEDRAPHEDRGTHFH